METIFEKNHHTIVIKTLSSTPDYYFQGSSQSPQTTAKSPSPNPRPNNPQHPIHSPQFPKNQLLAPQPNPGINVICCAQAHIKNNFSCERARSRRTILIHANKKVLTLCEVRTKKNLCALYIKPDCIRTTNCECHSLVTPLY